MSDRDQDKGQDQEKSVEKNGLPRRDFLKIMGATASVAAVSCQEPQRKLYPYIVPQNNALVGESTYYATVCRECPAGCGLHVRVREGRAIKLEGNPEHPINRGRLCGRGQAGLLRTYSPDRIRRPMERTDEGLQNISWEQGLRRVGEALRRSHNDGQGKVVIWSGLETGTLRELFDNLAQAVGGRHLMFDPNGVEPLIEAHYQAFGLNDVPRYQLEESDLVVALEADLFETYTSPVEVARQVVGSDHRGDHRAVLLWVGPRRGVTGMLADHWVPIRPGASGFFALALLGALIEAGGQAAQAAARFPQINALLAAHSPEELARRAGLEPAEIQSVAERLTQARRPVIMPPGPVATGTLGAVGHAAVVVLNEILGAYRRGFSFGAQSALSSISRSTDIREEIQRMSRGEVDLLIIADQNPLFDLPGGLDFAAAMERVGLTVALTDRKSATTERADVVLPISTPLESWGDYMPREGVVGLIQPVMEPLHHSRMTGDIIIGLARAARLTERVSPQARTFEVALRKRWTSGRVGQDAVTYLREVQGRGGLFEQAPGITPELQPGVFSFIENGIAQSAGDSPAEGRLYLAPYGPIGSGLNEKATGGWLNELPEPTNAAVWGSPAELHPESAGRLGVVQGDTIEVRVGDNVSIRLPVVVRDSIRPDTIGVPVGGRTVEPVRLWPLAPQNLPADDNPDYRGSSAALLLPASALQAEAGVVRAGHAVSVAKSNEAVHLYVESRHFDQHGRQIARAQGVDTHGHISHELPVVETEEQRRGVDLHQVRDYQTHRWAMAIDLDRCTGCSACIVSCYAENNIHIVGPEHVEYGREMHWLQIHTYWERDHADRAIPLFVPVMCQHCSQAPCESVCPVYAPYHNPEGLNGQVYNRCVGTRFCSNNCPYKVRRFNWYDWPNPEPLHEQFNPDVTVRPAGVMEKCTFCIQRIREAKEEAKQADRELGDGDVVPACVQTCPTGALVFGDWLDENSALHRLVTSETDRRYHLLGHVGTRPAVTYLERVVRWRT